MPPRLLLYTRTTDYRHDSLPDAVAAVRALGGFACEHTEDPADLERPLESFAAVVFLSTSGDVLTGAGRERLERYVRSGGGFAGVHAAACTEYGWPYYGELLGARFTRHPAHQPGRVLVAGPAHPATRRLPSVWEFTDEWYDFDRVPGGGARVLLRADETSYDGGGMGADHPLAWYRERGPEGGRVFYTALGHAADAYRDPLFLAHLNGGLTWVATAVQGRFCGEPVAPLE
ncbi:ThuA domain-containing protein [Streptomyces argyrophyllae]|uniref:ThuA domain-containing protein n=1 Tax=Streptomyces argyrophylli TaxID=2726118 RepID=A0A6M4PEB6_9ACTN|nr:ThuA domain-containing protein [Streptomyces argyrophyllae]QJS09302.1 ThuA domain-containing protein [Streptomyces argyrophyllae]